MARECALSNQCPGEHSAEVRQEISGPQELLVGRFVVAWSRLDHSIDEVIWSLLLFPVEDRIITAKLDLTHKLNLLRGLAQRRLNSADFAAFTDIFKRINDLNEFRVLIVHGLWITIKDIPAVQSMRGKLPTEAESNEVVTTEMPRDLMEGLIRNVIILVNYLIDCRKAFYASPDTHQLCQPGRPNKAIS
jgi:hypothetical protein